MKAIVAAQLPRSTRQVGAYIERDGVVYESRFGPSLRCIGSGSNTTSRR